MAHIGQRSVAAASAATEAPAAAAEETFQYQAEVGGWVLRHHALLPGSIDSHWPLLDVTHHTEFIDFVQFNI